jgi:hypothetical protein
MVEINAESWINFIIENWKMHTKHYKVNLNDVLGQTNRTSSSIALTCSSMDPTDPAMHGRQTG